MPAILPSAAGQKVPLSVIWAADDLSDQVATSVKEAVDELKNKYNDSIDSKIVLWDGSIEPGYALASAHVLFVIANSQDTSRLSTIQIMAAATDKHIPVPVLHKGLPGQNLLITTETGSTQAESSTPRFKLVEYTDDDLKEKVGHVLYKGYIVSASRITSRIVRQDKNRHRNAKEGKLPWMS